MTPIMSRHALDVDGTRYVVIAHDDGTLSAHRGTCRYPVATAATRVALVAAVRRAVVG